MRKIILISVGVILSTLSIVSVICLVVRGHGRPDCFWTLFLSLLLVPLAAIVDVWLRTDLTRPAKWDYMHRFMLGPLGFRDALGYLFGGRE